MDNPNQGGDERLIHEMQVEKDAESGKENEAHLEDFEPFDVDKVDELEQTKEEND